MTKGRFVGLITLRMLGYWFAQESLKGEIRLEGRKAEDLLIKDGKRVQLSVCTRDNNGH